MGCGGSGFLKTGTESKGILKIGSSVGISLLKTGIGERSGLLKSGKGGRSGSFEGLRSSTIICLNLREFGQVIMRYHL